MASVRVGFGRTEITPPVGVELAGYGPFLRRRSTAVRSPLWARAVAVDDGDGQWVLVSCDLLGISEPLVADVTRLVERSTGFAADEIFVHATHTHSGPATVPEFIGWGAPDELYLAQLPGRIAGACQRAARDLAPAEFELGSAVLPGFTYDRMRTRSAPDNCAGLAGEWRPAQPTPHIDEVEVAVVRRGGAVAGYLVTYGCHPVVCGEQTIEIHGDYPAVALTLLEAAHPNTFGVFLQGAMGDLNPTFAHGPAELSYTATDVYGRRLADAVERAIGATTPCRATPVWSATVSLDGNLASFEESSLAAELEAAEATLDAAPMNTLDEGEALAGVLVVSLRRTLALLRERCPVERPVRIASLAAGDFRLVGANLELFHDIKRRVREEVAPLRPWVVSLVGGYLGYAPTPDAFTSPAPRYPAYEVPRYICHLPFTPQISERIVAAMAAHGELPRPTRSTTGGPD